MTLAIETCNLGKWFAPSQGYGDLLPWRKRKRVQALSGISLEIPRGEIFGILGPNGAGKTTLFKILGTLIMPTSGEARVLGLDLIEAAREVKKVLAYVVNDERSLHWRLTGRQNLHYFGALNNMSRQEARAGVDRLLTILDLQEAADRRVMYYSTGMKQKVALARGLLTNPDIILLDEPTRSLDPLMAQSLWRFIQEELVGRQGKTVLLATHNLEEARRVCHRVAVLHQGGIRACGTIAQLTAQALGQHRYSLTLGSPPNGLCQELAEIPGVLDLKTETLDEGGAFLLDVTVVRPEELVPLILDRIVSANGKVLACTPREQSLDDVLSVLSTGSS